MNSRSHNRTRVAAACGLLLLGLAAVSVGGCARGMPQPSAAKRPALAWRVDVLRRTLHAVVLVRGQQLCVERLDSPTATPIWTAPATATPTILAVDQPGGRIAVLLHSELPTSTSAKMVDPLAVLPPGSASGIVILSADGSVRRFAIHTLSQSFVFPLSRNESVVPDKITSGAFVGPDLLLSTFGQYFHRHFPTGTPNGTPMRLSADGSMTPLAVEGTGTLASVTQFVQLPSGAAIVIRGVYDGSSAYVPTLAANADHCSRRSLRRRRLGDGNCRLWGRNSLDRVLEKVTAHERPDRDVRFGPVDCTCRLGTETPVRRELATRRHSASRPARRAAHAHSVRLERAGSPKGEVCPPI
jgi:hypothetical protein